MRLAPLVRLAVLLAASAIAFGCDKPTPTMKNQPSDPEPVGSKSRPPAVKGKPVGAQ
jgi:hypothetical protein